MKSTVLIAAVALLTASSALAANCPPGGGGGPPISVTTVDIYASTAGHDMANTCRASANPCTPSGAVEVAAKLNLGSVAPVVHLAAGAYTTPIVISGVPASGIANPNATYILISGAGSGTTTLSTAAGGGEPAAIVANNGAHVQVSGLTITSSNGSLLFPTDKAVIAIGEDVILGSAAFGQLHAEQGAIIALSCGFTVSGGATALFQTAVGGQIVMSENALDIIFTGATAYSVGFADIDQLGNLYVPSADISFTGAQTSVSTGSISGALFTVSSGLTGTLHVGDVVSAPGSGIPVGTTISSFGTGAGGLGTYNLNHSATTTATVLYTYSPLAGVVTGPHYNVTTNSVIETNNGSATFFPGSTIGKIATGGIYNPPPPPSAAGTTGLGTPGQSVSISSTPGTYSSRNFAVQFTAGTAPGSSGSTVVTFGEAFNNPVCTAAPAPGTGGWSTQAVLSGGGISSTAFTLNWSNNGTNLTATKTYYAMVHCDG